MTEEGYRMGTGGRREEAGGVYDGEGIVEMEILVD